jgi:hypothetical protein
MRHGDVMCPYIVKRGEVHDGGNHYVCGDFIPGVKGSLADMEEVGAVEWVESPPREPAKAKAPAKASVPKARRR